MRRHMDRFKDWKRPLNESLVNNNYGFFKEKTEIPDYDSILYGRLHQIPKKYEGWQAEIEWMSPEKYFSECAKLQGTSYSSQFDFIVDEKVQGIKNNMVNGVMYHLPYLNYVENEQEGRHRVKAASELGQKMIPVLVLFKDESDTINDISEMVGKWSDLVNIDGNFYVKFIGDRIMFRLLGCIVSDYDYYFLDDLFYLKKFPGSTIEDILSKKIINHSSLSNYQIKSSNINYDGERNETILKYCVVLRGMRNNVTVINDCVIERNGVFYLKILNGYQYDFENFNNAEDMLTNNLNIKKIYVDEYNLLPYDENNKLYDIQENDVRIVINLFNKLNVNY